MNIELTYSEAVTMKAALDATIKDSHELLLDTDFEKKYPNCYRSVQSEYERAVTLRDRIQAELDKI